MRRGRPGTPPWVEPSQSRPATQAGRTLTSVSGLPADHAAGPGRPHPAAVRTGPEPAARLWHVTLSLSGDEAPLPEVRRALERLARDHPFLLTSRYAADHAEIRYWEQARDLHDAAAIALRLWGEHRATAKLPPWEIVGLEVIDRATWQKRVAEGHGPPPATSVGVHPYG